MVKALQKGTKDNFCSHGCALCRSRVRTIRKA